MTAGTTVRPLPDVAGQPSRVAPSPNCRACTFPGTDESAPRGHCEERYVRTRGFDHRAPRHRLWTAHATALLRRPRGAGGRGIVLAEGSGHPVVVRRLQR